MSELNSLEGFRDRFWYWRGKSGTRYIHSIYAPDACPPLPGAIFVTVQKLTSGNRAAVEVGRFCQDWDYVQGVIDDYRVGFSGIDEIHVHLLARSDDNADEVMHDLVAGIGPRPVFTGFHEDTSSVPAWQPGLPGLLDQCVPERAYEPTCENILASA